MLKTVQLGTFILAGRADRYGMGEQHEGPVVDFRALLSRQGHRSAAAGRRDKGENKGAEGNHGQGTEGDPRGHVGELPRQFQGPGPLVEMQERPYLLRDRVRRANGERQVCGVRGGHRRYQPQLRAGYHGSHGDGRLDAFRVECCQQHEQLPIESMIVWSSLLAVPPAKSTIMTRAFHRKLDKLMRFYSY